MSCICLYMLAVYLLCSSPPLSPVDPAAAADYTTVEYDYFVDAPSTSTELPGKQSPFPSHRYRLPFCIILALGIAATAR